MNRYALVALGLFPAVAFAQRATFEGLGHLPGGVESHAAAVSADGRVVAGRAVGAEGPAAVRWTRTTGLQILEPPPAWGGPGWNWVAAATSADGSAIAGTGTAPTGAEVAFRWTAATGMQDLGDLPGGEITARASAISADGSIVVGVSDAGAVPTDWHIVFRWTEAGGMEPFAPLASLPVLPLFPHAISGDGQTMVGVVDVRGYRWTATGGVSFLEVEAWPYAVSSDGEVLVGYDASCQCAFRWEGGVALPIAELPGATSSGARAVTADGAVVVGWSRSREDVRALIWDQRHSSRAVLDVLVDEYGLDLTGWHLEGASDISADGTVIVGWGQNPAGQQEGWVARLGGGPCYADCDASGQIDFFDFLCFQEAFAAGEPWADCDGSGELDVFDFLCFQNAFAAGCP